MGNISQLSKTGEKIRSRKIGVVAAHLDLLKEESHRLVSEKKTISAQGKRGRTSGQRGNALEKEENSMLISSQGKLGRPKVW